MEWRKHGWLLKKASLSWRTSIAVALRYVNGNEILCHGDDDYGQQCWIIKQAHLKPGGFACVKGRSKWNHFKWCACKPFFKTTCVHFRGVGEVGTPVGVKIYVNFFCFLIICSFLWILGSSGSRGSSFNTVARLNNQSSTLGGASFRSSPVAHLFSYAINTGVFFGRRRETYLCLVSTTRMRGIVPLLLHTSSFHDASLSTFIMILFSLVEV